MQPYLHGVAGHADPRGQTREHGGEAVLGDLAAAVGDVAFEQGAHPRPVLGEAEVPVAGQCGDHPEGRARFAQRRRDERLVVVEQEQIPPDGLGRGGGDRGQFVVEPGQRGAWQRCQEVRRPQSFVDECEQHLGVERVAGPLHAADPRQVDRESAGVAPAAQRQDQLVERGDGEPHARQVGADQPVSHRHEAERYINREVRPASRQLGRCIGSERYATPSKRR
ncbi:hypothetical protein [Actinoplanes xinjiangensis]|uniref:hypothetical protein n=1 Tax=Actinoplanes xinjiangensis TaxID=512350 RepID=UPI0034488222